ncbi:capsule assembly Wzi family protein [Ferruginibacter yonginensis]|uniref:Capsule assembly Wzi family protein n=1 Tax=Ferruginibacter yonginensis TaxID=1310416 RepID=A0ABV8QSW2_9BACT
MQIIKSFIKLMVFVCPFTAAAQSTYLNQGSREAHFIDRMEIKQQYNTDLNFSTLRPFNRKYIVKEATFLDSARMGYSDSMGVDKFKEWTDLDLTPVDEYNLQSLLMNNSEWVTTPKENFLSKKPLFNTFYKTKANFLEVNNKDVFIAINPILQIHQAVEPGYDEGIFLNSRGVSVRGLIGKKIGFSTFLTDNQERGPRFFQQQVNQYNAVPGVGFYKEFKKTGVDYFDARGYFTFNVAKFIDVQFGHDKNFIGNGYRSLFLSDWGNSYLFAKLNTKVWKFNYQNIFMELTPQFRKNRSNDTLIDRKYAAIHHLSMNVTKWLNIGLFEGIVFGRKNRFDFQYLNPVIFYRHVEGSVGSPDNALAGIDFKANVAHRLQFYGQFLLDEFILGEVKNNPTSWVNKFGIQAGVKYVDAFGVKNLDVQGEVNRVRPFTYSHNDSISNYTHYNQPLAHPLGANFTEVIGIARYQPIPRLTIDARAIYYQQGLDSAGINFGSNIFELNTTRIKDNGFKVGSGAKATCFNGTMLISYELKTNLFLDASLQHRTYSIANLPGQSNTTLFTAGIRLNMFKRQYDF